MLTDGRTWYVESTSVECVFSTTPVLNDPPALCSTTMPACLLPLKQVLRLVSCSTSMGLAAGSRAMAFVVTLMMPCVESPGLRWAARFYIQVCKRRHDLMSFRSKARLSSCVRVRVCIQNIS
jgi:hypothetical protein